MKWMLNLPTSSFEEPTDPEANGPGEIQRSESEQSPIGNTDADESAKLISYERFESYSGPLPDPATLRDYQSLYPQAVELLFTQFAKVTDHNMSMEERERDSLEKDREVDRRALLAGQKIAALLGLGCIAVALILALNGEAAWSAGVALSSITVLAGKFIASHFSKRERSIGRGP